MNTHKSIEHCMNETPWGWICKKKQTKRVVSIDTNKQTNLLKVLTQLEGPIVLKELEVHWEWLVICLEILFKRNYT